MDMTARTNSVTLGDPGAKAATGLTIAASGARSLMELAVAKGASPIALAERSRIDPADLEDRDNRIPFGKYVAPVNSCVNTPKNGWSATRWAMGGDYFGFAAAPNGTFRAVWADSRSGVHQLRFATIEARRDGTVSKAVSR